MYKTAATLTIVLLSIAATANADWPMTAANPQRTSWVSEEVTGSLQIEWALPIEAYITEGVHLVAANNKIYVSSSRGLYVLNAVNGSEVWRLDRQIPLGNAPTVDNGVVYVPGLDRRIYALDDGDGSVLWRFEESSAGYSSNPLVINGVVYTGCRDGYFYAINASTGNMVWRYPDIGQDPIGPIIESAAYENGVIYFAANDCFAYALNASNGSLLWKSAKLPGHHYQSFWPVIYRDKVVFSVIPGYKPGNPGTNGIVNSAGESDDSYNKLEKLSLWPGSDLFEYIGPTVSISEPWTHGNTVRDASLICEHYEDNPDGHIDLHKPWRRLSIILDLDDGTEYTMDSDGDGFPEYCPVGYYGKRSQMYPPIIGINDDVYYQLSLIARTAGYGMTRGQVFGWNMGTPYVSINGIQTAGDEPEAISGGGNVIYQVLCCCREGGYDDLDGGSRQFWTYSNPIMDLLDNPNDTPQLPGLDVMWWGRSSLSGLHGNFGNHNGIYHDHGDQNPLIPYNGRVYVHRSNAVVCYGPGTKASAPLPILEMDDDKVDNLPAPTVTELKAKLAEEIQKIINAGNLKPAWYNPGQWHHTALMPHFLWPTDTLLILCRAYNHISAPTLKADLESYIMNQWSEYFYPTMYGAKGWSEGVSRDWMEYPPEIAQQMTTRDRSANTSGRCSFNYPPHGHYAIYKFAELFPTYATQAYNQARGRLQVPVPATNDYITGTYGYEINMYISGYIGFLKLQELAGMEITHASLRAQVQNELDRLLALKINGFTKDSYFTTPDQTLPDGQYRGRRMNVSMNWMFMCPELADHMRQNLLTEVEEAIKEYNWVGPYWFISRYNGTVSEGATSCLYHLEPMFATKAWILKEPYEELVKYLDVSGFKTGDLHYLNTLISTIEAPHAGPTIEPEGGGTYVDPVTVTVSMPSAPTADLYYTLDGSEPNDTDMLYTAPFVLTANTTVKAVAYTSGQPSGVTTAVFAIDTGLTNQPPAVDAGDDQAIQLPDDTVDLAGTVYDATLAFPILSITTSWSKTSGPGTVTFDNDAALSTTATLSTDGIYVLRLTAYEGALEAFDEVTITVDPKANEAPIVNAGTDQEIVLPVNTVSLAGSVIDDYLPDPPATVGTTWSKISGAGEVYFGDASQPITTATFSGSGTYVLQLDANDGEFSASDTVTVTVYPPLLPGAVAHLKLDDGGGTVAVDSSGNGNDGSVGGGAVWSSGVAAGALTFDGVNDLVTIANSWKLDSPKGTWSLWVKTDGNWGVDGDSGGTTTKGNCVVLTRHNASASREGSSIIIMASGTVRLQCKNASDQVNVDSTINVTNNVWRHIAATYDQSSGGALKLYIDGQPVGSGASPWPWAFNNQNMLIGDSPDAFWEEFAGQIDDVQIYNIVLSDADIAMLYNNAGTAKKPGDINSSNTVDEVDLEIMAAQWLQTPGSPSADICPPPSGDGTVDILDLAVLANGWLD